MTCSALFYFAKSTRTQSALLCLIAKLLHLCKKNQQNHQESLILTYLVHSENWSSITIISQAGRVRVREITMIWAVGGRVRIAHILSKSITVQSYRGVCKHSESGLSIHVLWLLGSMWVSSQIRGLNQALGLVGSMS